MRPTSDEVSSSTGVEPWIEEDVSFSFEAEQLYAVLTLPPGERPHPAIVLVTGSVSISTGLLDGASSRTLRGFVNSMVVDGYAVLRRDLRGVGRSTGEAGVETIPARASESIAALHYFQTRPDILFDQVGLWGASQASWVIALAAAEHRVDVAFIISVSGAGISVADQQVWGIESQSRAAGLGEDDVAKAVLFGRLLVDWQLADPKDYMARVECPVLAFFGESDVVRPSEVSARLFEEYLNAAGLNRAYLGRCSRMNSSGCV